MKGIPIGQLLIEQGVLTARQVQEILDAQTASNRPFGDLAERLFGIDPSIVEDAWVEQYVRTAPKVDLDDIRFDADCLRLLNRRQAWQFHLLPANRDQGCLAAATDADNLVRAVNFSSRRIDEAIHFLLAERQQLRDFLMEHYPVPEHIAQYAETLG